MKREGASTLFIHGFPWALRYLLILKIACVLVLKVFYFVITLVSVLKDVTKFVLKISFERCLYEKFLLF